MQPDKFCSNCVYVEKGLEGNVGMGRCKRYPPTLSPYLLIDQPKPKFDVTLTKFVQEPWLFPIVSGDDWCGEFEL